MSAARTAAGPRRRVLCVLRGYPQISQTYVKAELEALSDEAELCVLSRKPADLAYANHRPFHPVEGFEQALELARAFRPDVLHTHYLNQLDFVGPLAEALGVPFTVRSHSFDVVALRRPTLAARLKRLRNRHDPSFRKTDNIRAGLRWLSDERCLGVLAFPFARPLLERHGVRPERVVDCFPVVAVDRFLDRSPNGEDVLNTGAVIPKKAMGQYLELARRVPDRRFHLYPLGYRTPELSARNAALSNPVVFHDPVEPEAMPAVYKRHRWLVYTADFDLKSVGWPMAVAEAQASGVGVCMPRIRPDLEQYVGGAGVLYRSVTELVDVVRRPVPDALREAGFEQAQRSNVRLHRHLLTDLWPAVGHRRPVTAAG